MKRTESIETVEGSPYTFCLEEGMRNSF